MQLYFIRHAQSTNNHLWEITGDSNGRVEDPALTDTGKAQVRALAKLLKKMKDRPEMEMRSDYERSYAIRGITHFYTSPMLRAVCTAVSIAPVLDLKPILWKEIHESGGIYMDDPETGLPVGRPGKGRSFFEKEFPRVVLPDSLNDEGWWNRPFEERTERLPRAQKVLAELLEKHGESEDRVMLVSHGGFYNYFLRAILNLPSEPRFEFGIGNTAISRIDFIDGEATLVYLNRAEHLMHMVDSLSDQPGM